ncbi:MAG: hypothetical protein H6Q16_1490 [Bacteroidetes bacterium]|nr:hypothetical protein [Bacteroidota bacterium]
MENFTEELSGLIELPINNWVSIIYMLLKFLLNFCVVYILTRYLYYTKSKRRDYFFSFILISVSIFFLIYLLGNIKIKIGFALGLFAIFGIIRYRTESIPIREMTYLFAITSISVINALAENNNCIELLITNIIFLLITWGLEKQRNKNNVLFKLIKYDKIQLIVPEKREELIKDLTERTGLKIKKIEIGHIDFLKDSAIIKIYYQSENEEFNTINTLTKFPNEEETNL